MILRLSQKLNAKITAGKLDQWPLDENPYGDWSGHLFTADRTQFIIMSNTPSLYSCVMYGKGIGAIIAEGVGGLAWLGMVVRQFSDVDLPNLFEAACMYISHHKGNCHVEPRAEGSGYRVPEANVLKRTRIATVVGSQLIQDSNLNALRPPFARQDDRESSNRENGMRIAAIGACSIGGSLCF